MTAQQDARQVLSGFHCRCGANKREGQPFCWECYTDLLPSMQKLVIAALKMGSMERYADACRWLDR